jgi:hypothetical protein
MILASHEVIDTTMSLSAGIRTNRHDPPFLTSRVYFHFNLAMVAFVGRVDMPCPFWFSIGVRKRESGCNFHNTRRQSLAVHIISKFCIGYG